MGSAPSRPLKPQHLELAAKLDDLSERAARAIASADVLLVASGAGFSADSGLAVYRDVADVKAYHERGLTYHDLCQPSLLEQDPGTYR